MAKVKTEIPLVILVAIQQLHSAVLEKIGHDPLFKIEILDQDEFIVKHIKSEFSFQIRVAQANPQSKLTFRIIRSPFSEKKVESLSTTAPNVTNSLVTFDEWLRLVRAYDSTGILPSDPSWKYAIEYFEEYKILEEDADREPFDIDRQDFIFLTIQEIIIFLEEENNVGQLKEIINEAAYLKENLGSLTKNETVFRISKILGNVRKQSADLAIKFGKSKAGKLLLFILKETSKELIRAAVKELGGFS